MQLNLALVALLLLAGIVSLIVDGARGASAVLLGVAAVIEAVRHQNRR